MKRAIKVGGKRAQSEWKERYQQPGTKAKDGGERYGGKYSSSSLGRDGVLIEGHGRTEREGFAILDGREWMDAGEAVITLRVI